MPDMDGPTTCQHIRDYYRMMMQPKESDAPDYAAVRSRLFMPEMICCSAYDEVMIKKKTSAVGMSHILSKPPEIE